MGTLDIFGHRRSNNLMPWVRGWTARQLSAGNCPGRRVARCKLYLKNAKLCLKKNFEFDCRNFYRLFKKGQMLKKFKKISRPTDLLKKWSVFFGPGKGQIWQPCNQTRLSPSVSAERHNQPLPARQTDETFLPFLMMKISCLPFLMYETFLPFLMMKISCLSFLMMKLSSLSL